MAPTCTRACGHRPAADRPQTTDTTLLPTASPGMTAFRRSTPPRRGTPRTPRRASRGHACTRSSAADVHTSEVPAPSHRLPTDNCHDVFAYGFTRYHRVAPLDASVERKAPPCATFVFFLTDPPTTEIYTLSLHDALPI